MGNKTDRVQGPGRPFSRLLLWTALALAGFVLFSLPNAAQTERTAVVLEIDGAIGPAMSDYLSRGIAHAQERNAGIVVIRMDTPGGLDTSMRAMNRAILAAPMPVATFVHPSGARAASAGTYILYASHIAAMAPGTTLGAATPVQIGGGGGLPFGQQDEDDTDDHGNDNGEANETSAPQPGTAMERKVIEDAVAYIRGFAELRDRNADWAERAVREAASLSAPGGGRERHRLRCARRGRSSRPSAWPHRIGGETTLPSTRPTCPSRRSTLTGAPGCRSSQIRMWR
jgi:membrane-bound serine protease (ClpP class)